MQAVRSTLSALKPRVAVLYQAVEPPLINGVRKPMKPGGYRDSGADIAYVLQNNGIDVTTPNSQPDPASDLDWCFADTEQGILDAVHQHNATHLWANTILFSSHPLQRSSDLDKIASRIKLVGQPPNLVEQFDDKNFVNELLRTDGSFHMPKSWLVHSTTTDEDKALLSTIQSQLPVIVKPIRGRGSHGVTLCKDAAALQRALSALLLESAPVMVEEYLDGEEATVTVMPSSTTPGQYYSLPLVVRFNHENGIAPYNGTVAVTANSRALDPADEQAKNPVYEEIARACERVAAKLRVSAPIRVDVRQYTKDKESPFAIFDVNMKPNMTGPGRPGRENQASLTAMAAKKIGWDYPRLLLEILKGARPLDVVRRTEIR